MAHHRGIVAPLCGHHRLHSVQKTEKEMKKYTGEILMVVSLITGSVVLGVAAESALLTFGLWCLIGLLVGMCISEVT